MKKGRVKGGSIIPATIDTGRRKRSSMAQPIRNMAGSPRGTIGGAAQNIIEITSDDLVQNGGQYKLMGGTPLPMKIVTGRRSKQGAAQVVYPVDALGNYDPTFAGYIHKVLTPDAASGYDPSSLIQFLPQNELAGGVSIDYSGLGNDGAYTAANLGQPGVPGLGMSSAGYDGATSFNNIYSVSLNTSFSGAAGTIVVPTQVANAGVWTDGAARQIVQLRVDAANRVIIQKAAANNSISFFYSAGGTAESQLTAGLANTNFAYYGITWDIAAGGTGEVRYYIDGLPSGAVDVGLGIWVGNLANNVCCVGSVSTGPADVWNGNIGPYLLYNTAQSPAAMAYLSTP